MLPLFLGNFCSVHDNYYYANFILLLEIYASLKCYSFSESDLIDLENNVERHNVGFSVLYRKSVGDGGNTITPKLHALLHMARQIRLFGAPRYAWCYRYESKNAPFKKIMRRNCNFKNVPFTMANQHQKLVGLDLRSDGDSDYFNMSLISINDYAKLANDKILKLKIVDSPWANLIISDNINLNSNLLSLSIDKINICGRMCGKKTVFMKTARTLNELPEFWMIIDILLLDNGMIYIVMEHLETLCFAEDHFSFIVDYFQCGDSRKSVIHLNPNNGVSNLAFSVPLQCFHLNNQFHIVPNYYHML